MNTEEMINNYWKYYLILEENFEKATRYVELTPDNYKTYSIEFVGQIQSICSEIDVVMKELCEYDKEPNDKEPNDRKPNDRKNMNDYINPILSNYSEIKNMVVQSGNILHKPFDNWDESKPAQSLPWWDAYNSIKHGRVINMKEANLENVLKSLMALYLLEMLLYKKIADKMNVIDIFPHKSKLFAIKDWESKYMSLLGNIAIQVNNM